MAERLDGPFALEVVPRDTFIPAYIGYVTGQGNNDRESYTRPTEHPIDPALLEASFMIARACELIEVGADNQANSRLSKVQGRMERCSEAATHTDHSRRAAMLGSVATILRSRDDLDGLRSAYDSMHGDVVGDLRSFRRRATGLRRQGRQRYDMRATGRADNYDGLRAERVALGTLTRSRAVFAMPALPHHDQRKDAGEAHDLVLFAVDEQKTRPPLGGEGISPIVTRQVQVKNGCLAFCPTASRPARARGNLVSVRKTLFDSVVLCSGHCDFGEPGTGLDNVASLLLKEQAGSLHEGEQRKLDFITSRLAFNLLTPEVVRVGTRLRTNGNGQGSPNGAGRH